MTEQAQAPGVATRAAAMRLLGAVLRKGLPLESALGSATGGLDRPDDRGLAHAIAAATLRRLADIDALIDGATAKRLPDDAKARMALRIALTQALLLGTPPHAAIATVLPSVEGGPRRLVHGVFGTLMRGKAALSETARLPDAVAARWQASWGEDMVAAAGRMIAAPPPIDLTLRDDDTAEWAERLGGTSLAPGHVRLSAGAKVADLPGYAEGAWWVQDISASLPARLIGRGAGRVLDLAAAPGGKTMQLTAAGWDVTAVDLSEARLGRLRENLARTRLVATTCVGDALTFGEGAPYDAVLLDAPCSATGIFRRHPDVLHRVRPRAIADLAQRQAAMLARAADLVTPGGLLIYAVCSLEPVEGEGVADAFAHSGFEPEPVRPGELPEGFAADANGRVRVLPGTLKAHRGADGFFVARWRRRCSS